MAVTSGVGKLRWGAVLLAGALALVGAPRADAAGHDLDGRMAPDMVFPAGMNGVSPGLRLSSLRGRVVWVKFILRDCPRCKLELPRAQQVHDLWGRSGLVVLVVVHELGPQQMRDFMARNGYTFPLATDPQGEFANRCGVRHRPTDYVIGIDGRVVASNSAPDAVLRTQLGHYRLARLGPVPPELESVRQAVWGWDYGTALRTVEEAVAKADATPGLGPFAVRLGALAREELDAQVARALDLERRRQVVEAHTLYDRLVAHFRATSIETAARAARDAFLSRTGAH